MFKIGPLLIGFLIFGLASCATKTTNDKGLNVLTEDAYGAVIDKWSDRVENYSGLNNTITVMATLVNSEVVQAQLEHNAHMFQWDQTKMTEETRLANEKAAKQTEVFVSFYSPERKWDDLYKSKTLWKVFLDVNGQRYEGKAVKIKLLTREVQSQYPYHTGYGTPYSITFPVDTKNADGKPVRLVFTGAIGSVTLNFGDK
ncbi:MAG: hypothetical protein H7326_06035 [Bdellovibrionaceae bacterium]|nr:hypothetical protein [Pseudobdellovibrionaceae bacterium]